jgi:hypothetical protein
MGTRRYLANAVLVVTTTTGTGTYTLGSAVTGYFKPDDGPLISGGRYSYVAVDSLDAPTIREVGEGILTDAGTEWTLSRAVIHGSLSAGVAGSSAINWASGTKYVFLTALAQNTPQYDTDGMLRALNIPKAWVVFNGSTITASAGVASVTDNGVGDFTVNFAESFSSTLYAIIGTPSLTSSDGAITTVQPRSDTSQIAAGSCRMVCSYDNTGAGRILVDAPYMSAVFLGVTA